MQSNGHVANFISRELHNKFDFNKSKHPGAHTEFIVAAARKKGLRIRKVGMGHYFYYDQDLVGGVRQMLPSLTSSLAVSACANKKITKELLSASDVPVPMGNAFKQDQFESAAAFFSTLTERAVVKPSGGGAGNGVTCGISNIDHFQQAWTHALSGSPANEEILVEEYVSGVDIRAYVVGSKFVAAVTRLPAFVIGDGVSSVEELLSAKSFVRNQNHYLRRMPITVDTDWVRNNGMNLDSIPNAGQVVTLNGAANLHQGGEHVDITELICSDLKKLAILASAAIPGLGAAGIDLLVKSIHTADGAVVLEANTKANISVHHLPAYGKAVDVAASIVDEMVRQHTIRQALAM